MSNETYTKSDLVLLRLKLYSIRDVSNVTDSDIYENSNIDVDCTYTAIFESKLGVSYIMQNIQPVSLICRKNKNHPDGIFLKSYEDIIYNSSPNNGGIKRCMPQSIIINECIKCYVPIQKLKSLAVYNGKKVSYAFDWDDCAVVKNLNRDFVLYG